MFHGPRRFFLKNRANKQKSYGFSSSSFTLQIQLQFLIPSLVWKRFKFLPFIGTVRLLPTLLRARQRLMNNPQAHATDLLSSWGPDGELKDYIIQFTNNLDPNGKEGLGVPWPQWDPAEPKALIFTDHILSPLIIDNDTYRSSALDYVADLSLRHPI